MDTTPHRDPIVAQAVDAIFSNTSLRLPDCFRRPSIIADLGSAVGPAYVRAVVYTAFAPPQALRHVHNHQMEFLTALEAIRMVECGAGSEDLHASVTATMATADLIRVATGRAR